MIKDWYNGYRFTNRNDTKEYDIFIPYSVIQAIKTKKLITIGLRPNRMQYF